MIVVCGVIRGQVPGLVSSSHVVSGRVRGVSEYVWVCRSSSFFSVTTLAFSDSNNRLCKFTGKRNRRGVGNYRFLYPFIFTLGKLFCKRNV